MAIDVLGHLMTVAWVGPGDHLYASPMNVGENDRELTGVSELDINRIAVRDRGSVSSERQTLVHEIVHSIMWLTGHNRDDDEREVQALASGILQTLRANPQLCEYLLEGAA